MRVTDENDAALQDDEQSLVSGPETRVSTHQPMQFGERATGMRSIPQDAARNPIMRSDSSTEEANVDCRGACRDCSNSIWSIP
jgi:hypothetical protein